MYLKLANGKRKAMVSQVLLVLGMLLVVSQAVNAESLPIKTYTIADGLVSNKISRIARDSRGFMWFCTEEGLSRFDGYTFTNYSTAQGLPTNWVDDFLETRSGTFLVATYAGLCVFNPRGVPIRQDRLASQPNSLPMFEVYRPGTDESASHIKVLFEDSEETIWCGTMRGLYRIDLANHQATFNYVELGISSDRPEQQRIRSIVEEQPGVLLIAIAKELYRRSPDGRTERITSKHRLPRADLMSLIREREGTLWIGTGLGLCSISGPDSRGPATARLHSTREGLRCVEVNAVFQGNDGKLWMGTDCGLYEFIKDEPFRLRHIKNMRDARVWSLNEDWYGNLWIGTAEGVMRLARSGFTSYTETDGIGFRDIYRIAESNVGEVTLYTRLDDLHFSVARFDGEAFTSQEVKPRAFAISSFDWHQGQIPIRDSRGEWWWPTFEGLFRFASASYIENILKARPIAHYSVKDGLPDNLLRGIYEDRRGDMWISIGSEGKPRVARWERSTARIDCYSEAEGLFAKGSPTTICDDKQGNIWIGFEGGRIARYMEGRFTTLTPSDGAPEGRVNQLVCDSSGRIWIASANGGLGRINDAPADRPQIVTYTMADGLASNSILNIAEDQKSRFYVATSRGLNHIDFETGSVRRFTANDGLANDQVDKIFRDRSGAFWFGTSSGVSRLIPQSETTRISPSIFINRVKVVGESRHISEMGETDLRGIELPAHQNHIEIDFGSLFFSVGDLLRYQYKLEGADTDWQLPSFQRSVNYANLKPGSYQFFVRAVNSDGGVSLQPAMLEFRVIAPIWQRWWFVSILAGLAGLVAFVLYRYRVEQLLELERVRTRIATDLHDDIGSSLSQIAIMSEVIRQQTAGENQQISRPLSVIAGTSRELVDAMADIVWAINPTRDHLIDLTMRMRQFGGDLLTARNIEFTFAAPGLESDIRIKTNVRRDVFLIFKEAINNAVRHSECSAAKIIFAVNDKRLMLKVSDNGHSFDPARASGGHGLASMKHRAQSIGGTLEILAQCGQGTTVTLQVPLRRRGLRRAKIST